MHGFRRLGLPTLSHRVLLSGSVSVCVCVYKSVGAYEWIWFVMGIDWLGLSGFILPSVNPRCRLYGSFWADPILVLRVVSLAEGSVTELNLAEPVHRTEQILLMQILGPIH